MLTREIGGFVGGALSERFQSDEKGITLLPNVDGVDVDRAKMRENFVDDAHFKCVKRHRHTSMVGYGSFSSLYVQECLSRKRRHPHTWVVARVG